jgi:hypothetical protein
VDSSVDRNDCGGCGLQCPSGQSCLAGRCASAPRDAGVSDARP